MLKDGVVYLPLHKECMKDIIIALHRFVNEIKSGELVLPDDLIPKQPEYVVKHGGKEIPIRYNSITGEIELAVEEE